MNIKKILLPSMGLAVAMILTASAAYAQDDLDSSDQPTVTAPPKTISPNEVLQMIQNKDPNVVLVDTQSVDGFNEAHIPGAINYPWETGQTIKRFPIPLPHDKMLVFYNACGLDCSNAMKELQKFGYWNVRALDGGWYKWVELKYPVTGKLDATDLATMPLPSNIDRSVYPMKASAPPPPPDPGVSQLTGAPGKVEMATTSAK